MSQWNYQPHIYIVTMEQPEHAKVGFQQCPGWLTIRMLCILLWITFHHPHDLDLMPQILTLVVLVPMPMATVVAMWAWVLCTMAKNNLGPHETTQGWCTDMYTIPSLMVSQFIHAFWFLFFNRVMPCQFTQKLSAFWYSSSTLCLGWGRWSSNTMTGIPSTITPNLRLLISYIGKTRCLGHKFDVLFDLWAANGNNGTEPPFASHDDLYKPSTPYS